MVRLSGLLIAGSLPVGRQGLQSRAHEYRYRNILSTYDTRCNFIS
ncbi:MAG: hypothetical protein QF847_04165 [Candidatus Marinimicrobia bacterium]|nr:hypothetical protein [Candidatus Neomarinimicrobiota bacterium]MDP6726426.1 hypothetical protein [Candidatus Neomarinimicrobiota bacterium]